MTSIYYCLWDMRESMIKLKFHDLNEAEELAVSIMQNIGFAWGRTEYPSDTCLMEYTERKAPGTPRVYVRITEEYLDN